MKRERLIEILSNADKNITEEYSDNDLIEYIDCLSTQENEMVDESRWWQTWEKVVKVEDNVFLKLSYARSSGDSTPHELGYEDNGLDDVWEVKEKIISKTVFVGV